MIRGTRLSVFLIFLFPPFFFLRLFEQTAATDAKDKADHLAIMADDSIAVPGVVRVFRPPQVSLQPRPPSRPISPFQATSRLKCLLLDCCPAVDARCRKVLPQQVRSFCDSLRDCSPAVDAKCGTGVPHQAISFCDCGVEAHRVRVRRVPFWAGTRVPV